MLRTLFITLSTGLLLAACSLSTPPPPPSGDADVAQLAREEADLLIRQHDYPGATDLIAFAYQQTPDNLALVLRYGELLEATHQPVRAAQVFGNALKNVTGDREEVRELRYRYALLNLFHLNDRTVAEQQFQQINRASHQGLDLLGCLDLQAGNPDQAIAQFQLTLKLARSNDQKAAVHYHLALAYQRKGDVEQALQSLYEAINQAQYLGLTADIETLWKQLKTAP